MQLRHRLYLDWLAFYHSFSYRWAHKPLCPRFRPDVLQAGRVYICRSCTMIWLGLCAASGSFTLLSFNAEAGAYYSLIAWSSLAITVAALVMFQPGLYQRLPRPLRDVQRFFCGFACGAAIYLLIYGALVPGLLILVSLSIARFHYIRYRKVRKLQACDGCIELSDESICSGFEKQATLIRRFEKKAADYIERQGLLPPGLG